jgi:hypothetical protein
MVRAPALDPARLTGEQCAGVRLATAHCFAAAAPISAVTGFHRNAVQNVSGRRTNTINGQASQVLGPPRGVPPPPSDSQMRQTLRAAPSYRLGAVVPIYCFIAE